MDEAPPADCPRVVVVDDEPDVRDMVVEYLGKHGIAARAAADGAELTRRLAEAPADLVLLDVNMPGEDGFTIARRLRAAGDLAIIMVTAAGEVVDRVVGLEVGADDYVTKPFDLRELRARVRSVLRRSRAAAAVPPAVDGTPAPGVRVRFGAMTLDLAARRLIAPDGAECPLTAMEFDLLEVFARHPNHVLSRDRLLDLAHHKDDAPFDRSIDIRVARLRRKIEPDPAKPQVIKTVRGGGYMFVPGKP